MGSLPNLTGIVKRVLKEYAELPTASPHYSREVVFDESHDHYLVINVGWHDHHRLYSTMIHVDVIDDKVWIQHDMTEDGVATDFVREGIPRDRIVLAFNAPELRKHTEFAEA